MPGLNPKYIVTDFEAALVQPIADAFPETRHQGCWFHFCQVQCPTSVPPLIPTSHTLRTCNTGYLIWQALYRKIRSMGLLTLVKENSHAAAILRMCYVLPLLPWERMTEGLNAIESIARLNNVEAMLVFLDYLRGKRSCPFHPSCMEYLCMEYPPMHVNSMQEVLQSTP